VSGFNCARDTDLSPARFPSDIELLHRIFNTVVLDAAGGSNKFYFTGYGWLGNIYIYQLLNGLF